jgi:hypothetical protein
LGEAERSYDLNFSEEFLPVFDAFTFPLQIELELLLQRIAVNIIHLSLWLNLGLGL